jgi:hypothetical protein
MAGRMAVDRAAIIDKFENPRTPDPSAPHLLDQLALECDRFKSNRFET